MLDFGTTDSHSNAVEFPDRSALDAPSKYSIAWKHNHRANSSNNRIVIGKGNSGTASGWMVRYNAGGTTLRIMHDNVAGISNSTALVAGTTYSIVLTWDGTTASWNIDDAGDGSGAFSQTITANSNTLSLGNDDNLGNGTPVALGHVMIWPNYVLSASEISQYHAGVSVPALALMEFWHKGLVTPGRDEIQSEIGTLAGSVPLFSDAVDSDFSPGNVALEGFREVAGRKIRVLQHTAGVTTLTIPLEFLEFDLWDDLGLADDTIARASELLDSLEDHGLVTNWRRRYSAITGMALDMNGAGSLSIDLLDMEPIICTIFDTWSMPLTVTPDAPIVENAPRRFGQTTLVAGGLRTAERTSPGFVVQPSELLGKPQLRKVFDGVAKMNHLGMLGEDAFTNEVDNSCFIDGLTGWTTNLGTGGTIALDTTGLALFKDAEDGQQVVKIRLGSVGDVELLRTDVSSSTGDRRVSFWVSNENFSPTIEWFYARAGASPTWWRDSDQTWQASKVWNSFTPDQTNIKPWERIVSKRMTSVTSGNGTIGIGLQQASGVDGDAFWVGQIQAVELGHITSDAIVDNSGNQIGGAVDRTYDEWDNGGTSDEQAVHPDRGTIRFILRSYQDSAAITEGTANRHILATARWNADGDRDEIALEKVSSQVRIAFRRFISSAEDALAFANITLTEGTEYEIACRWTSPSDGELGLSARTLSVFADGTKGTDDQATGVHSSATQITQYYYGSTTSGIGLLHAANYIRNFEAVQRVIPDSEILGRR